MTADTARPRMMVDPGDAAAGAIGRRFAEGRAPRSGSGGRLGWPVVIAGVVLGILVVGFSYRLAALGHSAQLYYAVFWVGVLAAMLPLVMLTTSGQASRFDRSWGVALLGIVTAVPKNLRNPDQPLYHDEYAHWREAVDVLGTGQLFRPNALIPIVQFFPGTSASTAAVERISGLSVWSSGQLVVGAAHIVGLFGVFVLAEVHLRSARAGAIAAVVYALNPSAMYFDTQYAYESIAINLFVWVLALASLAVRADGRRQRIGFTVASVLCVAGCIVTHHLTTLFLMILLGLIVTLLTGRRLLAARAARRAAPTADDPARRPLARRTESVDLRVWWSVFAGGIVIGGLWLVFVAWPTVSYLSPYFGGSVEQLATMATDSGTGGRELLAASVQPLWERAMTALSPVVMGLICLVGVAIVWRERRSWSTVALGLIVFGLVYFPSVPFVLAPSGAEGARRSWGFTYVGLALVVALVALRPAGPTRRLPRLWAMVVRRRQPLAFVALLILLVGNVGGGLNDPYRFPGPFRWGTDTTSATDETRSVARQLAAQAGPVRVVSDQYTALQLVAYGGFYVAAPSAGFQAWDLTQTGTDPSPELARMLYDSQFTFLVVDVRMSREAPFNGANYGPGDPLLGRATPQAYLDRLDAVPWATRVMATEHLRVYRLDLTQIGTSLQGATR